MEEKPENIKRQDSKPRIEKNSRKGRKKGQKGPKRALFRHFQGGSRKKGTPFL
jgi:hypothetical protein